MKRTENPFFTPEQKTLIAEHILKGAPEFEIERFLITCERTGLDPFSRQIYGRVQNKKVKKRGTKDEYDWIPEVIIITSIDGFRAIAERSGEYAGQTAPEWYYLNHETGKTAWQDVFLCARDARGNPLTKLEACRVGIKRKGFYAPVFGVANFESFAVYEKKTFNGKDEWVLGTFWNRMPEHQIAKCAEAQGFRKAFPLLAQGLYVEEEIDKGDNDEPHTPASDELPNGAKWVEGHSPEDRAAAAAQPVAAVETPPEAQKPAGGAPEPEKPAPDKKPRGKKVAESAKQPEADFGSFDTEPEPEPKSEASALDWKNYPISQITIARYVGKKLSELSNAEITELQIGWVEKYADKIKNNPLKVIEAANINAAYKALGNK